MKIREFSPKDFGAVSRLWRRSEMQIRPGDSKEELRRKLERDPDLFLVAEEESKIVGVVIGGWDGRRGWIYRLAVDPRFRRRRIARKMLLEVERRMRKKGVPRVHALVFNWNAPSLNLFESSGYEKQSNLVVVGKSLVSDKETGPKVDNPGKRQ